MELRRILHIHLNELPVLHFKVKALYSTIYELVNILCQKMPINVQIEILSLETSYCCYIPQFSFVCPLLLRWASVQGVRALHCCAEGQWFESNPRTLG